MTLPFFTPTAEADFATRVENGEKIRTIARSLGIYPQPIRNAVRRHHERIAGTLTPCGRPRDYSLDEAAFDDAETNPTAAYFVGLIMADGCITARQYSPRLTIGFANDDGIMVERFKQFLGTDRPLYVDYRYGGFRKNNNKFTRITIDSKRIGAKLAEFGVTERKSFTASVLKLTGSEHFWRGMIDGDGFITTPKSDHLNQPCIGLVGSKPTIQQFAAFIRSFTECKAKIAPMHSIWRIETKGRFAFQIIRRLYGQGQISMPRKQAIADRILSEFGDNARPLNNPKRPGRGPNRRTPK